MEDVLKLTEDLKSLIKKKEKDFNKLISNVEDEKTKEILIDAMGRAKKNNLSIKEFKEIAENLI